MRLLWQNEHYPDMVKGGGGAMKTSYLTPLLQRLGHHPVILARGPAGQGVSEEKVNGVPVIRLSPPQMPASLWPIWPLLECRYVTRAIQNIARPFDACFFVDPAYGLGMKQLFPRRPVICRVEGTRKSSKGVARGNSINGKFWGGRKNALVRRVLAAENEFVDRQAWNRSDALLVESEFLKRDLVMLYAVRSEKISVISNGVDYARFSQARASRETIEKLDKGAGIAIIFCGRLSAVKNVSFLLRGFACMRNRSCCVLVLVGDGEERKALEIEAAQLDIAAQVRFVGHTPQVEKFLAAADIFVFPSSFEAFGNALLEAMAAGLPCVALQPDFVKIRTASSEHINEGQTGYLVDGSDPAHLASKLDLLVAEPVTRKRMGEAGQMLCKTKYSWERCASKYIELVQRVTDCLRATSPEL